MAFLILAALLVTFLVWNLNAGSYGISVSQVMQIFLGNGSDATASRVVWDIRLPRCWRPSCWRGALRGGISAPDVFRQPHRGPFVLGISSGAKLVVAMTMILCFSGVWLSNSVVMIAAAFVAGHALYGLCMLAARKSAVCRF
ncbi:MAG: iron chelate uptake ABC transporter family permease subunit [Evtepia sp.]